MRRIGLLLGVAAIGVLASASLATGSAVKKSVKFNAALNIGQEVPHPKGTKVGASGHFSATLDGTTLKWSLTFAHLSGPATAAHIHSGARGTSGNVLVALCSPCTSPASGTATLTPDQIAAMTSGGTYVNVHTSKNPNGEIRGQITVAQ
jgi:hypothetical protein